MDRKISLVGNFSTDWIRYSDYEYKEDAKGHVYLVPKKEATFTMYNPFDVAEDLVMDCLKLGDAYHAEAKGEKDSLELRNKAMVFVRKYGLMGLISSSVYNRDIIGEEEVLLMEAGQNCLRTKERVMSAEAYMGLFTPFAEEGDLVINRSKNSVDLRKAEDSPKYYGKRPLVMDLIFSRFYAERLSWILEFAGMLSEHFNQMQVYKQAGQRLTEPVTIMAGGFKASKLSLTIQHLDRPLISWDFDALKTALQTMYAFAVTDENILLSRCEHCKGFFIALSAREKYCGPVCRNRFNVQKSRQRKNGQNEFAENQD